METEGKIGYCPDWYAHIQAAKYLGVDPEALLDKPVWWKDKALAALTAENQAQANINRRNNSK